MENRRISGSCQDPKSFGNKFIFDYCGQVQESIFLGSCKSNATRDIIVPFHGPVFVLKIQQQWDNLGLLSISNFFLVSYCKFSNCLEDKSSQG